MMKTALTKTNKGGAVSAVLNKDTDTDLVSNIGRKVLYCGGCTTADFEGYAPLEVKDDKGKTFKACPHCGEKLFLRSEDRIHNTGEGKVLFVAFTAPRSTVIRLFSSPWGRVRLYISVNSFFAPFVDLNDRPSPAIKRLIDEEFSEEAMLKSFEQLGGAVHDFVTFTDRLTAIIRTVHRNPNAATELDLDNPTWRCSHQYCLDQHSNHPELYGGLNR
jgi:hypothetical protein